MSCSYRYWIELLYAQTNWLIPDCSEHQQHQFNSMWAKVRDLWSKTRWAVRCYGTGRQSSRYCPYKIAKKTLLGHFLLNVFFRVTLLKVKSSETGRDNWLEQNITSDVDRNASIKKSEARLALWEAHYRLAASGLRPLFWVLLLGAECGFRNALRFLVCIDICLQHFACGCGF